MSRQLKHSGSRYLSASLSAVLLLAAVTTGCQRAESPSTVGKDVAAAEQRAEAKTQRAEDNASRDVGKAQQRVQQKAIDRNNVAAEDGYKVAMARADGQHDIALQKCKALAGDAQRHCKQQADADYEASKANAKASEVSRTR
jgi:hypothetical protein